MLIAYIIATALFALAAGLALIDFLRAERHSRKAMTRAKDDLGAAGGATA